MPTILVTPPAAEPVSLADAKAHLRAEHAAEDELIGTLITTARRHAEAKTGLAFITQKWLHYRDGWPAESALPLPLAPLISIEEVAVFGADDIKAVLDPAHYCVDAASRPPRIVMRDARVWPAPGRIANGISVSATFGFGPGQDDVPEQLRQAVLLLVAHWYDHRGNANPPPVPLTVAALLAPFREARL